MSSSHRAIGLLLLRALALTSLVPLVIADICPQACDPHHNKCDVTAPTCIFPDPHVSRPRGACACRPGYKATRYKNDDITVHWRLPVESHEHRVWVAEGVKCDSLCDVSTGDDSCREVLLIGSECVGDGYKMFNNSVPILGGVYGNHSEHPFTNLSDTLDRSTPGTEDAEDSGEEASADARSELDDSIIDDDNPSAPGETGASTDDSVMPIGTEPVTDDTDDGSPAEAGAGTDDGDGDGDDESPIDVDVVEDNDDGLSADDVGTPTEPEDAGPAPVFEPDDDLDNPPAPEISFSPTEDAAPEDLDGETDEEAPSSSAQPDIEARSIQNWPKYAEEKGSRAYNDMWNKFKQPLPRVVTSFDLKRHQDLCSDITRAIVETCKLGVRVQAAECQQPQNKRRVECRKNNPDGLSRECCKGEQVRRQARGMCAAGLSTKTVQKQIQAIGTSCSITTGLAKAAMNSYLSGKLIALASEIDPVRALGDQVPTIQLAEAKSRNFLLWAKGLSAAANGKYEDAQEALRSLAAQITPSLADRNAWEKAAVAAVNKNVLAFLAKFVGAAAELDIIQASKEVIMALRNAADNLRAIRVAAKGCRKRPRSIAPAAYPRWKKVKSKAEAETAVVSYKEKIRRSFKDAAKCRVVVERVDRVLKL